MMKDGPSCTANLTYDIGEGGLRSDCRHEHGRHYCILAGGHGGQHQAIVAFDASTQVAPFLYSLDTVVFWT